MYLKSRTTKKSRKAVEKRMENYFPGEAIALKRETKRLSSLPRENKSRLAGCYMSRDKNQFPQQSPTQENRAINFYIEMK
jgi:hypothetical protein